MLSLIFQFHSVQDPSPGAGAVHIQGGSPLKHSANTVMDMPRGVFLNPTKLTVKINYHTLLS